MPVTKFEPLGHMLYNDEQVKELSLTDEGKVYPTGQNAYRDGYDLIVEEGPHRWRRVEIGVAPESIQALGATITAVTGMEEESREVLIETDKGTVRLVHFQHCCEDVRLLDVAGDPEDLFGGLIVTFEQRTGPLDPKKGKKPKTDTTYTFFAIRTTRGDVTLRWGTTDSTGYGTEITVQYAEPA